MNDNTQICRACGSTAKVLWGAPLLKNMVHYAECPVCGYVQTEEPNWLEEAYTQAINNSDTGIMVRNLQNADIVISTLMLLGGLESRVVDAAGGYGILVRLLRDVGVDAFWDDRYCDNLLARGFEFNGDNAYLVTAFEAFEHFVEPAQELDRLLSIAPNVLLSTEFIAKPTPNHADWWYYGSEHGQHIGFFRECTLRKMAEDRNKYFVTDRGSYHLITDRKIGQLTWNYFLKLRKITSLIARRKLKSRTWSDHLLMKGSVVEKF